MIFQDKGCKKALFILSLIFCHMAPVFAHGNYIDNPGFELGTQGWVSHSKHWKLYKTKFPSLDYDGNECLAETRNILSFSGLLPGKNLAFIDYKIPDGEPLYKHVPYKYYVALGFKESEKSSEKVRVEIELIQNNQQWEKRGKSKVFNRRSKLLARKVLEITEGDAWHKITAERDIFKSTDESRLTLRISYNTDDVSQLFVMYGQIGSDGLSKLAPQGLPDQMHEGKDGEFFFVD